MTIAPTDAFAALRVLCGVWFLPHCLGKIRRLGAAAESFEGVGLRPGRPLVIFTIALELLAASGLVLGLYKPWAAGLALVVLGGAAYAIIKRNGVGWAWHARGLEYIAFWAIACVISILG